MSEREEKELIKKRASFKGRLTGFAKYINDLRDTLSHQQVHELQLRIGIEWISSSPTSFLHLRALKVGNYCIIRAHHERELVPGSLNKIEKVAYIPYGGRAVPVNNFEVLCAKGSDVRWLTCSAGNIPPGAIAAGRSQNGEQLYVGRAHHRNLTIPGKVHPSHKCCYIPYSGAEVPCRTYEVLCKMYA